MNSEYQTPPPSRPSGRGGVGYKLSLTNNQKKFNNSKEDTEERFIVFRESDLS